MATFRIRSYLILDLETTGFLNSKITEISLLGVFREHIEDTHIKIKSTRLNVEKPNVPRVVQKLNMCVYPNRMISNLVSEVTGLSNDLLQMYPPFNANTCEQIIGFINLLPKPICMLAHNGIKFDFPIIKSELEENGVSLPEDLHCADTLLAFRALLYDTIKNNVDREKEREKAELLDTKDIINLDSDEESEIAEIVDSEEEVSQRQDSLVEYIKEVDQLVEVGFGEDRRISMSNNSHGDNVWDSLTWDPTLQNALEKAEEDYLKEIKSINLEEIKSINEETPKRKKTRSKVKPSGSKASTAVKTIKEAKQKLFVENKNVPKP